MPEKAKNKTNLQQRVSLRIILPKIIPLLNDTRALRIMFPATQNNKAKNARKKPKTKTNLQECISLHITLPQIVPLQNHTKNEKLCSQLLKNE